jgi:hypothetical protein
MMMLEPKDSELALLHYRHLQSTIYPGLIHQTPDLDIRSTLTSHHQPLLVVELAKARGRNARFRYSEARRLVLLVGLREVHGRRDVVAGGELEARIGEKERDVREVLKSSLKTSSCLIVRWPDVRG